MGKFSPVKRDKKEVRTGKTSLRISPRLITGILLTLIFAIALFLRAYLPYDQIFTPLGIKFSGNDAYYQMRIVDIATRNFPQMPTFDPYLLYPGGVGLGKIQFFNWLLAGVAWLLGLGSPSGHLVDVVGVYFPAVLGALVVLPVFFTAQALSGRWAGLIAAALMAIIPGESLGRSGLGFTDYHVAEAMLTATAMLFLILAIKRARQVTLSFLQVARQEWTIVRRPIFYSLLAGLFLGLYISTWIGALLFVAIIGAFLVIQFIIDYLKRRPTEYLCIIGVVLFAVAWVVSLPASPVPLTQLSLGLALALTPVLFGLSRLMSLRSIRPLYYPLSVAGLGLLGVGLLYWLSPSLFQSVLNVLRVFAPSETLRTTIEAQSIFKPLVSGGNFFNTAAWGNFSINFFLSIISLIILVSYFTVVKGNSEKTLLVIWSLVMLAAIWGQRRFAYYFAVNISLLTGYLSILIYHLIRWLMEYLGGGRTSYMSWQILELSDIKAMTQPVRLQPTPATKRAIRLQRKKARKLEIKQAKLKRRQETGSHLTANYLSIGLSAIVIFLLAFYPLVLFPDLKNSPTISTASSSPYAPSDAWLESLLWLKNNSPEPFGSPEAYYQRFEPPPAGDNFTYPASAYGVMAWWDYGYWITRIGHRIPNVNPGQDPVIVTKVANYFTAQEENSANEIAREMGTGYVVLDYETASSKFWAVATWAGKPPTDFFANYWVPAENSQRTYIHADYYRSLSSRLYNFDGKAVKPEKTLVIAYELRTTVDGLEYRELLSEKEFSSYEEAEAYIASQKSGNYKIVGTDPLLSPVPLEELKQYRLVYSSEESVPTNQGTIPAVKVFEFTDRLPLYGQ